jgi:hypothetical protein
MLNVLLAIMTHPDAEAALIFRGAGRYSFLATTVCEVRPMITRVQVDCANAGPINSKLLATGAVPDHGGPAGITAMATLFEKHVSAQAMSTNTVGEELLSSIWKVDPGFHEETILVMMVAAPCAYLSIWHSSFRRKDISGALRNTVDL